MRCVCPCDCIVGRCVSTLEECCVVVRVFIHSVGLFRTFSFNKKQNKCDFALQWIGASCRASTRFLRKFYSNSRELFDCWWWGKFLCPPAARHAVTEIKRCVRRTQDAVISSTDASQLLPFIVSKSVIYYNIRYLLTDGHGVQRRGQTFSSGAHIHARRKKAIQSAKKKKKEKI